MGNIFIFSLSPFLSGSKWEKAVNKLNSARGGGRGGGGERVRNGKLFLSWTNDAFLPFREAV